MPSDLITVFRVFTSGEPQTFDDMDSAIRYAQSQVKDRIENVAIESAQITIDQYKLEVDKQEGVK